MCDGMTRLDGGRALTGSSDVVTSGACMVTYTPRSLAGRRPALFLDNPTTRGAHFLYERADYAMKCRNVSKPNFGR